MKAFAELFSKSDIKTHTKIFIMSEISELAMLS